MVQRNGFFVGLVVGLLVGLALALGVALYITKAPMPFVNKVPQRTAEQDSAEIERNRSWDPNAPLGTRSSARNSGAVAPSAAPDPATGGVAAAASASNGGFGPPTVPPLLPPPASERPTSRDPGRILSAGADPFVYFVQAGAYSRTVDAEQQRARLALGGQTARITEREQSGRTVYRVRLGPFQGREEADGLQGRLQEQGIDAQIVRVEK